MAFQRFLYERCRIASLLTTAKLNGLDPKAYLRHVLNSIA
jgi:hypothetical protein